jgi:predicted NBD/HSP70 family sugar kinase
VPRTRATVRDLRRTNRAAVLAELFFGGEASRQALSARTGLSAATITNVVGELLDEGQVVESGAEDSDGGRPRILLRINPGYGVLVGVDVGETRIRVELFDLAMAERAAVEFPLRDGEHPPEQVAGYVADGLATVLSDAGVDDDHVLGIGVGLPGVVEQVPGGLVDAPTYGWDKVPLRALLAAHTPLPLFLDNGAKTMGQAEMWFGAGRGARDAIVALLGTGVGAGVVTNGRLYRGAASSAGEWGHTTVVIGGRRCRCGARGCLEAYAGAEAILDRAGISVEGTDEEAALAGLLTDPAARPVLDETARYLGVGLGNLINLFNPERLILGGWVGLLLGPTLLPGIRAAAAEHSLRRPFAQAEIVLGQLGPDAVALGAATLAVEQFLAHGGRPQPQSPRPRQAPITFPPA